MSALTKLSEKHFNEHTRFNCCIRQIKGDIFIFNGKDTHPMNIKSKIL